MSHYDWLNAHFGAFLAALDVSDPGSFVGLISAHGDKCYSYERKWAKSDILFAHGVAVYLLTHMAPWNREVRDTTHGWVAPVDWVIKQYPVFAEHLASLPQPR